MPKSSSIFVRVGVVAWVLAVATCLGWQLSYDMTPGLSMSAPRTASAVRGVPMVPGKPVVIMGLHPRCPCSAASLKVFNRLSAIMPEGTRYVVLVSMPHGEDDAWVAAARQVQGELAGAEVIFDRGGEICSSLGMQTSGAVVYYAANGRLRFSGGITPGRGMVGSGTPEALRVALEHDEAPPATAPTFGCRLVGGAHGCGVEVCHK